MKACARCKRKASFAATPGNRRHDFGYGQIGDHEVAAAPKYCIEVLTARFGQVEFGECAGIEIQI